MSGKKSHELNSISKTTTIKDISERAGVSIGTVDRALNGRGRINSKTKQKVLQAAKDLNYKRNEFARVLRVGKKLKLLAIYQTVPDWFTNNFTVSFEATQESLSNYGLQLDMLRTQNLNPEEMLKVTKNLDISSYDGILINAGGPELNTFIDNAMDSNIPVATFNSDSPTSKRLFFSGEDHFGAGRLSGELVAKLMKGSGKVSIFSGIPSVYALSERIRGFTDIISDEYPNVNIINNITHYDDPDLVIDKAIELLLDSPMPDAVFCNSATGALPICQILEKYNVKNKPIVIGYDEDEELANMLKKGICTALIFQDPKRQARNALQFMFQYLYNGMPIPTQEESLIIPTIVMKGNLGICS